MKKKPTAIQKKTIYSSHTTIFKQMTSKRWCAIVVVFPHSFLRVSVSLWAWKCNFFSLEKTMEFFDRYCRLFQKCNIEIRTKLNEMNLVHTHFTHLAELMCELNTKYRYWSVNIVVLCIQHINLEHKTLCFFFVCENDHALALVKKMNEWIKSKTLLDLNSD